MDKKLFKEDFIISIIFSIIFLFINYRISIGIIVGYIFSLLNYRLIEYRYRNLDKVNVLTFLGPFISVSVLVLPLVISFLIPNIMHYIGVIIGLTINRTRLIITAIKNK